MSFRPSRFSGALFRKQGNGGAVTIIACCSITALLCYRGLTALWRPSRQGPLLWSRTDLQTCLSSKCLHSAAFVAQGLSVSDAAAALGHMSTYLSLQPAQPPDLPVDFLETARRSSCAVVGGAPLPPGQSAAMQSRLVDETTQLTLRLNVRSPELLAAERAAPPLGTHTDAVIVQRSSLRSFERYIHGWGEGNATLGETRRAAGKRLISRWHPLLVFRPECPSRFASCPLAWEALGQSSLPAWADLHLLHYQVEMLTNRLLRRAAGRRRFRIGTDVPSTGIIAVVASLQMCSKVHVFAFNGSVHGDGDVPGQTVWHGHKLLAERTLLRWLEKCPRSDTAGLCGKLTIYS